MTEKKSISFSMSELMPFVIEQIESGQTVTLPVKGVSMEPFLRDNKDSIFLVSPKDREPEKGDLYMFRRADDSYAMHRVYSVNSDTLDFVGDNQFILERVSKDAVVAYVPRVVRKGKEINCEKGYPRNKMIRRMNFRQRHKKLIYRKWYITMSLKHPFITFKRIFKRLGGKK